MDAIREYFSNVDFVALGISLGGRLLLALLIFYVGRWIARLVQGMVEKVLRRRAMDEVLVDFLGTIVNAMILIAAIIAAIDTLGIPATSLVAVLGAAGLAIGLALKDSLSNFAAGVMLVMFRPFTKGDLIEAGGVSGVVDEVRLVSTQIITGDNKQIMVPNAVIWGDNIINFSARDTRRLDMVFGVGYEDDLKLAEKILRQVCESNPLVLAEPAVKIFVNNLGDSTVDFVVRPWVKTEDYWTAWGEIMENAKLALDEAGLNIPYPQTDVHLHTVS